MKLSTSDIIQIIGILVALLTGIISIIISIIALCQNSKTIKESNMAQIEVFPLKIYGDTVPRIKVQNFGKTTGTIIDVNTSPKIPDTNNIVTNPFEFYKGLSLASGQSFTTIFSKCSSPEVPLDEFDVEITYTTINKTIKNKYHINYKFIDGYYETKSKSTDSTSALDKINQSIQGLQQK